MLAALWLLAWAATPAPPPPAHWVSDEAGVLSQAARQSLERQLAGFAEKSGHQVVVYVGRTTGGEPIEDFAVRTFEAWKVGRAGIDDGAALFVMTQDRTARIEVGYGLESSLTDAQCARILRDQLGPAMRAGDADGAVLQATAAMLKAAGGEEPPLSFGLTRLDWVAIAIVGVVLLSLFLWRPRAALFALWLLLGRGGRGRDGRGFSGGGGRSGGGGATGHW